MENLDKWWGVAATVAGVVTVIITTLLTATSDNDPATPDSAWQKALRIVSNLLTRIFSVSTFSNEGGKTGFELKLPGASAAPKKKP